MTTPPPVLTFDPIDHAYKLSGARVHSVTQILTLTGASDYSSVPSWQLDEARERGTAVHRALELVNRGILARPSGPITGDLDLDHFAHTRPEWTGYVRSWLALVDSGRLRPWFCEHRIASFAPRYAGTLDWLGVFDGEAALLDFATGDPRDAAKHLQTAGYVLASRAWAEMPGEEMLRAFHDAHPYVVRYAVQLHRDGSLPTPTPYRDPRDYSTFLLLAHAVNAVTELRASTFDRPWQHAAPEGA